jgi:hypothetical protein
MNQKVSTSNTDIISKLSKTGLFNLGILTPKGIPGGSPGVPRPLSMINFFIFADLDFYIHH